MSDQLKTLASILVYLLIVVFACFVLSFLFVLIGIGLEFVCHLIYEGGEG